MIRSCSGEGERGCGAEEVRYLRIGVVGYPIVVGTGAKSEGAGTGLL